MAELSQTLYRFLWNEVCDWYLECLKPRLYLEANSTEKKLAASVVVTVFDGVLRLLHNRVAIIGQNVVNVRVLNSVTAACKDPPMTIRQRLRIEQPHELRDVLIRVR